MTTVADKKALNEFVMGAIPVGNWSNARADSGRQRRGELATPGVCARGIWALSDQIRAA
jgi:hypothetical protein